MNEDKILELQYKLRLAKELAKEWYLRWSYDTGLMDGAEAKFENMWSSEVEDK